MKRRIVSLLLAVIMLFGLLPVTALAETLTSKGFGSDGKYYYHYNLNGLSYDGISINYTIWGDLAANYDIKWELYTRNIYGGSVQNTGKTDKSLHEHNLKNVVGHSFNSSKYWFYLEKWDGKQKWKLDSEVRWAVDTKDADSVVTIGSTCLDNNWAECGIRVYLTPLNVPMEDSTKPYLVSVTQKSKAAIEDEPRDVELYVEGKYVGKQVGAVRFPNREDAKASDLNIKVQDGFDIAKIEASGSTYKIYLVYGPRKVTIRYKLIGDHKTKGAVDTNGLKNSAIADVVFQDKSWNQSNNFIKEYNQLPLSTVEIDTARSTNQLLLYEAADVKLVSGDAGIENSGTDKYKITVGYENSVIEVAYKAKFHHVDPLYIDWYKRGAGGIFDLLKENANQPYGFDLTNLHEQETFYVIQNGGLTQAAKEAGLGQEYVDSKGQHYRFWKAAVGFDWDWIDSLYYKSSAQTWFYTYKINLYYRDIFAHEWKVWKTITVGPIDVPYDEGRINFVYQRYNPDTGVDDPEDTGDYSFTLAYDGNAGTEPIGVPQPTVMSKVALSDKGTYEIPVSRYQPERTDYKFLGWDENPNATTPTYPASANTGKNQTVIFTAEENNKTKTLYAIWEKTGGDSATYTATYYWNYTENTNSYHTQENLKTGNKLTQPNDPTRDGYTFGGWYTTDTCTDGTKWDFATNTVQKQDIYLYAKWTEAASTSYTINYYKDYQDGNAPFDTISGNGYVGDEITAPDKKPTSGNYVLDTSRTTKTSMKLVEDSSKNILNVYYEKDEKGGGEDGDDPDNIPDKYQKKVTFQIVNGTWADSTDADKIVYVTLYKDNKWDANGEGTLTAPTGMTANATYDQASGKWNTTPPATVSGTADVTYKYSFSKSKVNYTVNYFKDGTQFDTVSGSADIGTSVTADVTTKKPEGYVLDTAASTTSKELDADSTKNILNIYYEKDEKGGGEDGDDPDNIPDKYQKKVTYKVVNGTWSDGKTADKYEYVTLLDENGKWSENGTGTLTVPTGMTPDTGFIGGSWAPTLPEKVTKDSADTYTYSFSNDTRKVTVTNVGSGHTDKDGTNTVNYGDSLTITISPDANYCIEKITLDNVEQTIPTDKKFVVSNVMTDKTVEITYAADDNHDNIPDKYQKKITYKVVNGFWDTAKTDKADKVEYVTLLDENSKWSENGTGTLTAPTGMTPDTGFIGGSWDALVPTTVNKNTTPDTYTYTFIKDDGLWATVTYEILNGHGSIDAGQTASFTVLKGTKWGEAGITAPTTTAESGYRFAGWIGELAAEETIKTSFTITGSFVINEGDWVTIQFAAGPNGSLIGDTSVTVLKNTLWSEITVPETKGDTGYTFLEWSPALPNSTDAIMESATYTAYFTKKDGDWVSVDYVIVGGHGDFVSGAQTHFEILKDTLWGEAGISAPAVEAEYGYYFDGWTGELAADEAISENITVVGRFEQEFDIIPAIIEILKPRDMLTKEHIAYLNGYSDGTVRPNGNITRAEVATIFFRLLTDEVRDANLTYGNTFTDVPNGAWYNAAVSTLSSMQIINGYTDGSFRPNQNITRAELASIIARFAELKNTSGVYFTDIGGHWAADNICLAAANGWITGYADGSFKPNRPVTRAETVTMINRVLERSPLSTDDLLDGMVTYSDNLDTTAWYYLAIQEASNTHDYTRMTVGEFWRSLLPNRDWSRYQR